MPRCWKCARTSFLPCRTTSHFALFQVERYFYNQIPLFAKLLYSEQMNGMKNIAERRKKPLGLQTKPFFFSNAEKYD
jgi:hypothetical protein